MKFENVRIFNFEGAIRGMRNPKDSWHKLDSFFGIVPTEQLSKNVFDFTTLKDLTVEEAQRIKDNCVLYQTEDFTEVVFIGPNDLKLMQTLIKAGSEHRKFMRQIFVSVDITAPLYWWKEFDTYKVGTVANSTSTMHKLTSKPITMDCFEMDDFKSFLELDTTSATHGGETSFTINDAWEDIIHVCNLLLEKYLSTKEKKYWKELIRILPESWLQKRTVTMSYENLFAMCSKGQRRFHKLNEWSGVDEINLENFIHFARTLPYAQELIFIDEISPETIVLTKEEYENLLKAKAELLSIKEGF